MIRYSVQRGGNKRGLTPTTPQVLMEEYLASISLRVPGTFAAVVGGAPVVWKKLPRAFPFSSLSGGYLYVSLVNSNHAVLCGKSEEISPRDISWVAFEPIGHEDLILIVLVGGREDISALEGLWEIAKYIIDVEDSFGSVGGTSNVYIRSCWLDGM